MSETLVTWLKQWREKCWQKKKMFLWKVPIHYCKCSCFCSVLQRKSLLGTWLANEPSASMLMDGCSLGDGCSCVSNPLARVKISPSITESVFDPRDLWRATAVLTRRSWASSCIRGLCTSLSFHGYCLIDIYGRISGA